MFVAVVAAPLSWRSIVGRHYSNYLLAQPRYLYCVCGFTHWLYLQYTMQQALCVYYITLHTSEKQTVRLQSQTLVQHYIASALPALEHTLRSNPQTPLACKSSTYYTVTTFSYTIQDVSSLIP